MCKRVPATHTYQPLLFQDQVRFLLLSAVLRLQVLQPDHKVDKAGHSNEDMEQLQANRAPPPIPRAPFPQQDQSCR